MTTARTVTPAGRPIEAPAGPGFAIEIVRRIERISPFGRRSLAWAAGVVSMLAMPPFHAWPVLWLTLPLLAILVDVAAATPEPDARLLRWRGWRLGRAAETGWWFGFGYHLAGLFWIGEAFLVEAEVFAWLLPFAVTLLPAGLALLTALATAGTRLVDDRSPLARTGLLAIGFGLSEWLRGHILTGFPWNVLGTAIAAPLPLLQSVSVFGIYGLTIIAVLIFAGPFAVLREPPVFVSARHRRWLAVTLAAGPLALLWLGGVWHLAAGPQPAAGWAPAKVRLVQPSISQRERLQAENQRRIFDQHLSMSLTAPDGHVDDAAGIDIVIWPEAAMPFVPLAQPVALAAIGAMLPRGTQLLSGALRVETTTLGTAAPPPPAGPLAPARSVFNSLLVLAGGTDGAPAVLNASYDKTHLVPFGEYLPAQGFLEAIGLQQLTRQRGGFTAGGHRSAFVVDKLGKVLPLICYEVIFPLPPTPVRDRPDLIVTITNDGWFGDSTGPRQHYYQARIRAAEQGIPMLRASSNGISALIDGNGRELSRLDLNAVGTLDVIPPPALTPTIYARFGDKVFLLLTACIGALVLGWSRTRAGT